MYCSLSEHALKCRVSSPLIRLENVLIGWVCRSVCNVDTGTCFFLEVWFYLQGTVSLVSVAFVYG